MDCAICFSSSVLLKYDLNGNGKENMKNVREMDKYSLHVKAEGESQIQY
jgi:hypothetical protein